MLQQDDATPRDATGPLTGQITNAWRLYRNARLNGWETTAESARLRVDELLDGLWLQLQQPPEEAVS